MERSDGILHLSESAVGAGCAWNVRIDTQTTLGSASQLLKRFGGTKDQLRQFGLAKQDRPLEHRPTAGTEAHSVQHCSH